VNSSSGNRVAANSSHSEEICSMFDRMNAASLMRFGDYLMELAAYSRELEQRRPLKCGDRCMNYKCWARELGSERLLLARSSRRRSQVATAELGGTARFRRDPPTAGIGASSFLPPVPAKVALPNRQPPFRLRGRNCQNAPLPPLPSAAEEFQ
jgi:hypothetical protein